MTAHDGGATDEEALALLDDYDFALPDGAIAQTARAERDAARLLLLDRESGAIVSKDADVRVRDLASWLAPGDLLVVNATQVLPARLVGRKRSGGVAEALLLGPDPVRPGQLRALLRCTGRVRVGLELAFTETRDDTGAPPATGPEASARVEALHDRGEVTLEFDPGVDPYSVGRAPLPPYIRREASTAREADLDRYQTIYAREPGAVAAPTAGLHFTPALFAALEARGIAHAEVILHVGAGTFRPLDAEALSSGELHAEDYRLPEETVAAIERTRRAGGRVIAVGTTTARVLESCADETGRLESGDGTTRLFLRPGGRGFRVVDGLLTNFHLPRSSLLMLVATFVGREPMLAAYHHAIEAGYRFYSYGDAMLIAPGLEAVRRKEAEQGDR